MMIMKVLMMMMVIFMKGIVLMRKMMRSSGNNSCKPPPASFSFILNLTFQKNSKQNKIKIKAVMYILRSRLGFAATA